jgi:hypothetical protein
LSISCTFFVWAYAQPSELRLANGEIVDHSETGYRQGDPLASLFFCVEFQALLFDVNTLVKETVNNNDSMAGVIAYMDDCSVYAPVSCINEIAFLLVHQFEGFRLHLAVEKCRFLGNNSSEIFNPCFRIEEEGEITMGCPTGNEAYRVISASKMISDMATPLVAIDQISTGAAFNILRSCINSRPVYLSRVLEMAYTSVPLQSFDTLVDDALLRLVGAASAMPRTDSLAAFVHRASVIRSLPTKLGGLGLARHAGINSEKKCFVIKNINERFYCTFLTCCFRGHL